MPLSYAVIFGGVITVLGTSTNLIVSDLLQASGKEPFGIFEVTAVGLPVALVAVAAMAWLAPRLLGDRSSPSDVVEEDVREYVVEMLVVDGGPLVGQTVVEAGLRHLQGVYLVAVERDGRTIAPVSPDFTLEAGDRLTFSGNVDRIVDLQRERGLESAEQRHVAMISDNPGSRLFEAVVSGGSTLLVDGFSRFGDIGVLLGIFLATIVATEALTNNTAAVLMFPVAMAVAEQSDVDPRPLAVAILIAASCSFLTPIGYQTNAIVYGLGGYRFGDFSRLGLPLTVLHRHRVDAGDPARLPALTPALS